MTPQREKLNRPLPSDPDAEQGILGTIILDHRVTDQAVGILSPDDFYNPHYRSVFRAIVELQKEQKIIDPFTISDILRRDHSLDAIGGTAAITNLSYGLPYAESIEHWVESVREKATLRALVRECDKIQDLALAQDVTSAEVIESAGVRLKGLINRPAVVRPQSIGSLWAEYRDMRPPVIEGLLRRGEVMNIIAKSKVGKSWLTYLIACSVSRGFRLFGQFQCSPGKVLIIDNELHRETLSKRTEKTAWALGIEAAEIHDRVEIISLRGNLTDIDRLKSHLSAINPGEYQLVILDAFYRMLPKGTDENSNSAIMQVYNKLDEYAEMLQAAFIVIHHASKGGQADKSITDVGSGAGAQSRAADTHLVLRPHQEEGCVVLDAAVRSWPPVESLALRWDRESLLWRREDGLDPAALKGRQPHHEERQQEKDREGEQEILRALSEEADTIKGLTGRIGMGPARIERLVGSLVQSRRVVYEKIRRRGQDCKLYSPVDV